MYLAINKEINLEECKSSQRVQCRILSLNRMISLSLSLSLSQCLKPDSLVSVYLIFTFLFT